jgi:transposase-like protein
VSDVRRLPVGEDNEGVRVTLDDLAREGARWMIAAALEAEVEEYVSSFTDEVGEDGKRLVVRNGRARERKLTVGSGTVPIRAEARKALERFRDEFDAKYPKAVAKLDKDWDALTAFYDFPAEHWRHLRTTNPIESSFATVKLRTKVTKGAGSKKAALAMAYKLLDAAQKRWRRVNGHELVTDVLAGVKFKDGIKVIDDDTTTTDEKVAA